MTTLDASPERRRWALVIGLAVVTLAIVAISVYLPRLTATYELYWGQENIRRLFYEDLGLSEAWSSFIAVLASFFYALAWVPLSLWTYRVFVWKFNTRQLVVAFACWVFVYGHVPLLHAVLGSNACFNQRTGAAMKWYVQDADGRFILFDSGGYDPITRSAKHPVTPDVCAQMARVGTPPKQIQSDIDTINFFDPVNGRPLVWYYKAPDGGFELFSSSGFHPRTGEPLKPVTKDIAAEIKTWAEHGGPKIPKMPSSIIPALPPNSPEKVAIDDFNKRADAAWRAGDFSEAMKWLQQAAARGDGGSMFGIGRMYRDGLGVPLSYAEAIRWFNQGAEKGDLQSIRELGRSYLFGIGVEKDVKTARTFYTQAANMGDAEAMTVLGVMYLNSDGTPQDYPKALGWFRQAAYKGNATSMFYIGFMSAFGYGTPQDYSEALRWYHEAADRGQLMAVNALGFMYQEGQGLPAKDYAAAMKWYRQAADNGYGPAMLNIGMLFQAGHGVPQDYKEAMKWYRSAADMGIAAAMDAMGVLYADGLGTKRDCDAAKGWFQKAAENGNPIAKERLLGNSFCSKS